MGYLVPSLILFPFIFAILIAITKNNKLRGYVVFGCSAVIIVISLIMVALWGTGGNPILTMYTDAHIVNIVMMLCEIFLMCFVVFMCFKHKRYLISVLSIVQTLAMIWMEEFSGIHFTENPNVRIDFLTVIMVLIIALVGCFIAVYAVGYMRGYHNHHKEYTDRTGFFLSMMFVFLGAMMGLVLSESLTWIYFFWEITSVISFLLIGYTRTPEAITNSFRALWMNLLGGVGFAIGIIWFALDTLSLDLQTFVLYGSYGFPTAVACVGLLAFAALTKSAQFPFSPWLLGAMVAPTPSSALLHSATMVKAGVYLLIRLAPALAGNQAGTMVAIIGGITFFMASLLAISTSDGKRVLAYSTVSNLGLITACAGIGAASTVWAAIFLVIFHATSKSLLFQSVGAIENTTGTRDIEDMHGLFLHLPRLATYMLVGICGMFLAPFGMLVSKWAALKAFIDNGEIVGTIMVLLVCFGSASTLLYWSKWLGKLIAIYPTTPVEDKTEKNEYLSLTVHTVYILGLCLSFPLLSTYGIQPIIEMMYGDIPAIISTGNLLLMVILLMCVLIFPSVLFLVSNFVKNQHVIKYMAGVNSGDSRHFMDSLGNKRQLFLSSWYLEKWFGEKRIMPISINVSTTVIVLILIILAGGAL